MKIVEIEKLENGSHRNQIGDFASIPDGWAIIPDDLETPNFPFGEITVDEVNDVATIIKWTPTEIPIVEEIPFVETEPSTSEVLNTLLGV